MKLSRDVYTGQTKLYMHFLSQKLEIVEKNNFLLTLWLLQRPKAPVKNGAQSENYILPQRNRFTLAVILKSALVNCSTFARQSLLKKL